MSAPRAVMNGVADRSGHFRSRYCALTGGGKVRGSQQYPPGSLRRPDYASRQLTSSARTAMSFNELASEAVSATYRRDCAPDASALSTEPVTRRWHGFPAVAVEQVKVRVTASNYGWHGQANR